MRFFGQALPQARVDLSCADVLAFAVTRRRDVEHPAIAATIDVHDLDQLACPAAYVVVAGGGVRWSLGRLTGIAIFLSDHVEASVRPRVHKSPAGSRCGCPQPVTGQVELHDEAIAAAIGIQREATRRLRSLAARC
jgi:hypothetical protein